VVLACLLLLILFIAAIAAAARMWRRVVLAEALAADGWVLYTRPGCAYCSKQLAVLGVARYSKQMVCGPGASALAPMGPVLCKDVPVFPYWVNERTLEARAGLQHRRQLWGMLRPSS
jgi:hypothetical protein